MYKPVRCHPCQFHMLLDEHTEAFKVTNSFFNVHTGMWVLPFNIQYALLTCGGQYRSWWKRADRAAWLLCRHTPLDAGNPRDTVGRIALFLNPVEWQKLTNRTQSLDPQKLIIKSKTQRYTPLFNVKKKNNKTFIQDDLKCAAKSYYQAVQMACVNQHLVRSVLVHLSAYVIHLKSILRNIHFLFERQI